LPGNAMTTYSTGPLLAMSPPYLRLRRVRRIAPGDTRAWEPQRRPEYVVTIITSESYPSDDQARQAFDEPVRVEHRIRRPE
jgi:hypothetical protein